MNKSMAAIALTLVVTLGGCGGGGESSLLAPSSPPLAGITIARTTDAQGKSHALSLEQPAPALQAALQSNAHFVVITRSTYVSNNVVTPLFVVNGDVAVGDWRFGLDFAAPEEAAPILLFKATSGSVQDLAGQTDQWTGSEVFNADTQATQSRLVKIIATAIANGNAADPALASLYAGIAAKLTDPQWNGVLILNPVLPVLPAVVQGHASGLPQGQRLAGHHLGVTLSPVVTGPVFGLVDYPRAPAVAAGVQGDGALASLVFLRALFSDSALASYQALVK